MVEPLKHLDYRFETHALFNEYFTHIDQFVEHKDIPLQYKEAFQDFKILKVGDADLPILWQEYKRFVETFELQGYDIRPRYYVCEANGRFPPHKDMKTQCAVNHIVSDRYAPLIIEDTEYMYKTAVFNTQREHHVVNNGYEARVLIKFSFFDLSYEDLLAKLSTSLVQVASS